MSPRVGVLFHFPFHGVRRSLLGLSLLLIVGCASESPYEGVTFTKYTKKPFPPTHEVEIFSQDVERGYTIIGELEMTFSPGLADEEMVNRVKEVSRGIGADAIIGFKKEEIEIAIPDIFPEPIKKKARHQPLEISSLEAKEGRILVKGLAIRYR
jgi:hypothetical protein